MTSPSSPSAPGRVGPREIAELLAWCRRLSAAEPGTDPAERAAYLAAKTDLLTRITDTTTPTTTPTSPVDQHEGQR
jgi:hypothetical protein